MLHFRRRLRGDDWKPPRDLDDTVTDDPRIARFLCVVAYFRQSSLFRRNRPDLFSTVLSVFL